MITRRTLFGIIAAPAIIKVASIMPIKVIKPTGLIVNTGNLFIGNKPLGFESWGSEDVTFTPIAECGQLYGWVSYDDVQKMNGYLAEKWGLDLTS